MSDDVNAGMNLDPSGWEQGLNAAQKSAARFIAFLAKIEGTFQQVASGSLNVAGAVAAIGGVSKAVEADLQALHAGEMTLAQMMSGIGGSAEQMNTTVQSILTGNASLEQSINAMGVKWDQNAEKIAVNIAALERMKKLQSEMKASSWRQAIVDPTGKPIRRSKSADTFMSTDPMAYDSPQDIRIARMMQRMKKMATGAGIEHPLPSIELGEGKAALNMARMQMSMEQLREKVKAVKTAEDERESAEDAHFKKMRARLNEAIKLNEQLHAAKRKQQLLDQAEHKRQVFTGLDQMYGSIPKSRIKELQTQGVITLGKESKKTGGFLDNMFKKFEKGTALGTKATLGMVRGLQNANSQMALLTSSFTGLVAMVGGVTAGAFFKMSMDFEKAMARVNLLVKKGESDLKTLNEQAKELSRQFGNSPMANAEGMRIAISSDIPPGEVMQFMKEASKLAAMSNAPVEKTADLLAMLRNAFGLATSDMSRLRDMIFVMTDRGRTEVEQFASEIGKIAPTAKLAGVNIQEMMAAFAGLSRTRSTEQAGTLLRNLFKNIIDPSKEAKKAIQEFGLGLTPAAIRANGLIKTVANFRAELQKHPGLLNTVADDLRELAAWGDLTDSQFTALVSTFDEMTNSVGLADQKTKEMMDTTSIRWDRMMAQLKISAIDMGASLLGVFGKWTEGANGVEIMQKRIESGFKRLELAVRYFMAAVDFVGVMAGVAFGTIATALSVVYGLLKGIFDFAERGMAKLDVRGATKDVEEIQAKILKLKEGGLGEGSKEVQTLAREMAAKQAILDTALNRLDESEKSLEETIKNTIDRVKASWQPTKVMAEAFAENSKKANELAHEIADLDLVIKNMETDAKAAARAQQDLTAKTKAAKEAERDQAELLKQWASETLKGQVMEGYERLTQWVKDNRDAIKGAIAANREWAKEQHSSAQQAIRELEKLKDQRDKFNDSVEQSIDKIKDKDRTPKEQMDSRIQRGQKLEEMANAALKAHDKDRAEDLVKDAMQAYEGILDVVGGDTKENRKKVIEAMERLQGQMGQVFGTEQNSLNAQLAEATKKEQAFTAAAKEAEEKLKTFEQGVTDVGRAIKELGSAPSDEALMKIKEMILKLTGETGWFEKFTADPALKAMDKVIEKAQALKDVMGTVPDELIMKLQGAQLMNLLAGSTGFIPMEPKGNTTNNTSSNITNVDSIHVNVPAGEGGPKKADARRLGRDLKRYIERGETPSLGNRR